MINLVIKVYLPKKVREITLTKLMSYYLYSEKTNTNKKSSNRLSHDIHESTEVEIIAKKVDFKNECSLVGQNPAENSKSEYLTPAAVNTTYRLT